MDVSGRYPAVIAAIGGKQRRLSLEKQWRRAITNKELTRRTLVRIETAPDEQRMCMAGDVSELQGLFDEILGVVEFTPDDSPTQPSEQERLVRARPFDASRTENSPRALQPVHPEKTLEDHPTQSMTPVRSNYSAPKFDAPVESLPTPLEYMILPLRRYAEFEGRSGRAEYWWYTLAASVLYVVVALLFGQATTESGSAEAGPPAAFWLIWVALLIPSVAVAVRRLHDRNLSGWLFLGFFIAALIPFFNVIAGVAMLTAMVLPGTAGPNRFGDDPNASE